MKSELDGVHCWLFPLVTYDGTDGLVVELVEGVVGQEQEVEIAGKIFPGMRPVSETTRSRRGRIRFSKVVSCEVINESFGTAEEYDLEDDKSALRVLSRSKYLDYVNDSREWYKEIFGPAKHFRLITEAAIVEVIACDAPEINVVGPNT